MQPNELELIAWIEAQDGVESVKLESSYDEDDDRTEWELSFTLNGVPTVEKYSSRVARIDGDFREDPHVAVKTFRLVIQRRFHWDWKET